MPVNYSKDYVDRILDERDVFTLYTIVWTLDAERDLPAPFKLMLEMWNWCCSIRSGVWQYYENLPLENFQAIANQFDQHNLGEIAVRYRAGMKNWREPDYCGDLDDWIEQNWDTIEAAALMLVASDRTKLYPQHESS